MLIGIITTSWQPVQKDSWKLNPLSKKIRIVTSNMLFGCTIVYRNIA